MQLFTPTELNLQNISVKLLKQYFKSLHVFSDKKEETTFMYSNPMWRQVEVV